MRTIVYLALIGSVSAATLATADTSKTTPKDTKSTAKTDDTPKTTPKDTKSTKKTDDTPKTTPKDTKSTAKTDDTPKTTPKATPKPLATAAEKCQNGTTADASSCTNSICSGQTWTNCHKCNTTPFATGCWDSSVQANKCLWTGDGCTVANCTGHTVSKEITKPAAGADLASWKSYYWSQRCTYTKVHNMKLAAATTSSEMDTLVNANKASAKAAKAAVAAACATPVSLACIAATKKSTREAGYVAANTAHNAEPSVQNKLQDADRTEGKGSNTDAKMLALQTKNKAALVTATKAKAAADKALAADKLCAAKPVADANIAACSALKETQSKADAKVAQVTKWVDDDSKVLTNSWETHYQAWQQRWFKTQANATKTKEDMQKIQQKYMSELTATDKDLATQQQLVITSAANEAAVQKVVDDKTKEVTEAEADKLTPTGKPIYDAAVMAETEANKDLKAKTLAHANAEAQVKALTEKKSILTSWTTWGADLLKNNYQSIQITWMKNKIIDQDLLRNAQDIQKHNEKQLAAHEASLKVAVPASADYDTLTKQVDQEKQWVAQGKISLELPANQVAWHANLVADSSSLAQATALQAADVAAQKKACAGALSTSAACKLANGFVTADNDNLTAVNKRAAAKVKAAVVVDAGKTKVEAQQELATLKNDSDQAAAAVTATKAKLTAADCSTGSPSTNCEDLAATYASDTKAAAAALAAYNTQKAFVLKTYPVSTGATGGIIIGCVAGVLCIGGGAAWYLHDKKKKKAAGDIAADGQNFSDDMYTSMVDVEK